MSILRSLERRALERRGAPAGSYWGDSSPPSNGMLGGSAAGVYVSEKTSLQVAAVYGSVRLLANAVSSLPINLQSSPHKRTGRILQPSPLLVKPYAEISRIDWWVQFVMSLALRGNFFGQIIARDENLYPVQIKPIHPDAVMVRRMPDGTVQYRFHGDPIPLDNVFHVRFLSVAEGIVGLNPIEYLRHSFGNAHATDLYAGSFYSNSALPGGVISVEDDLDADETVAMAKQFLQLHQGINKANLPAVLTGGATFQPITITPEDAQFLQTREYDASVISGMIFGIPPHMIGQVDRTTSWGTGIEQQEMGWVRNGLIDFLKRGEEAITECHPPGQFAVFDLSERLRGDRLQRAQAAALELASGTLLPDEARADEDRAPLPGGIGQTAMAPINAQSLKALAEESIAQQQQEQQPQQQGQQGDAGEQAPPGGKAN